ncbi:hypothetical protein BaRGS_00015133 [Batillaria attramentaria]|uniref:Fibronectin type-III domain-containing protein n=1 Tax=Batillaria attramentaria TaxID=370345 RepID=A0ABD0L2X2_9CAEN
MSYLQSMGRLEHNGPGFHYVITWREEGSNREQSHVEYDWQVGRREVHVNNIYTPYMVKVTAQNNMGAASVQPVEVRGFSGEASKLRRLRNTSSVILGV